MTDRPDHATITGIHTVGVPVRNQSRSLDFYVEKLGFEKRLDAPFGDGRWLEVAPPGATTSIALVPTPPGAPVGVDTGIRLSCADAESDHATLLADGVDADPEIMRIGDFVPPMFTFRDPDGNRLVVVQQSGPAPAGATGAAS
jgi:catechol 2,3-dioxygenase-like lactoylglutathione lyase family enzyme